MPSLHAALPRALVVALLGALVAVAPASARVSAVSLGGWNRADQRAVERAGVLPPMEDGAFHGERPLAGGQLRQGLQALAGDLAVAPVCAPIGRVSVAGFDRLLVQQLGLGDVAAAVLAEARRAGLAPPARFGTEVVARQRRGGLLAGAGARLRRLGGRAGAGRPGTLPAARLHRRAARRAARRGRPHRDALRLGRGERRAVLEAGLAGAGRL
jgi:hypothetical protein